ncbi:hypothetical protein [Streptomyces sp. BH104]|uniref:hypothetical protein n=1 Tax=Streptomyces sp. BH104 TaxID=3410407 RepID=UPI003BB6AED5
MNDSTELRQPLPDETEPQNAELPPYTDELTVCIKCSGSEAFTRYRPATPAGLWDYNGRTEQRPHLPERLERECQTCGYLWDEALRPAQGVRPVTVDELTYALQASSPYPIGLDIAEYTATRLLGVTHILLRPEHPLWSVPPGPVHEQAAWHTEPTRPGAGHDPAAWSDPTRTTSGPTLAVSGFETPPDAPPSPPTAHRKSSGQ